MRVAVIGATGNAGTAVLRALQDTPEITEITGIARRMPDTTVDPYAGCRWESVDIAAASTSDDVVSELAGIFRGLDAVIHLAWLIQPNDKRDLLRRVNVDGTERVAEAVAAAGVPHLVVASSVGAYSPDDARDPDTDGTPPLRDEDWPTTGIEPSHYSIDKADQERVLDRFTAAHPDVAVTRLRPGLIFQGDAASAIQRYFLGSLVPVQALRAGRLPALPLPKGLQLQALHSDDVGRAYAAAVVRKAPGAFNVCADDILGPQELADIVDHGHFLELPPAVVRAAVVAANKSGLVNADAGWIDMGMQVPMMDNSRAKEVLGWEPRHTAAEALRELLDAMIAGDGLAASPVLRPRDDDQKLVPGVGDPAGAGADAGAGQDDDEHVPEKFTRDLLNLYLSDHLTGATAGANRIQRMADDFVDTPVFSQLSELASDIRAERTFLRNLIHDLGLKQMPYRQAVAWAGERVGRLKGNGRIISRSPMTMLLETELMRGAILGKMGGWQTLREHADELNLDPQVFDRLVKASEEQIAALDEVHKYARIRALRDDRHTFWD